MVSPENESEGDVLVWNKSVMVEFTMDLKIHMYVAIFTNHQQKKIQETKEENSAVSDSGCTGILMTVYAHLNNVRPTTKSIHEKFLNGQIIRYAMESELYLPILPTIGRQGHISPNIKH